MNSKTKEALEKAIEDKNFKTEKWIRTSIEKGYEGVGVIFYLKQNNKVQFVLGINKNNEAEYPGGKCEEQDKDLVSTVKREVEEETGLLIEKERFVISFKVEGGTTGYPSYVFLVEISMSEFDKLKSPDNTFSKFIIVDNIIDCEKVIDRDSNTEYELRKFNRKYVIPQISKTLQTVLHKLVSIY